MHISKTRENLSCDLVLFKFNLVTTEQPCSLIYVCIPITASPREILNYHIVNQVKCGINLSRVQAYLLYDTSNPGQFGRDQLV